MSYLERQYKRSGVPKLENLIKNQFNGKYEFVTTCKNCKTQTTNLTNFCELELSIQVSQTNTPFTFHSRHFNNTRYNIIGGLYYRW